MSSTNLHSETIEKGKKLCAPALPQHSHCLLIQLSDVFSTFEPSHFRCGIAICSAIDSQRSADRHDDTWWGCARDERRNCNDKLLLPTTSALNICSKLHTEYFQVEILFLLAGFVVRLTRVATLVLNLDHNIIQTAKTFFHSWLMTSRLSPERYGSPVAVRYSSVASFRAGTRDKERNPSSR